jgi:hypothetical protein
VKNVRFLLLFLVIALGWEAGAFGGQIQDAAEEENLAKVCALVKADPALVSSRDVRGRTALFWAVARKTTPQKRYCTNSVLKGVSTGLEIRK